jgi:hypothetical protein
VAAATPEEIAHRGGCYRPRVRALPSWEPLSDTCVGVLTPQPTKGVTQVDDCGLTEVSNSMKKHMSHNLDRFGPQCA